MNSKRKNPRYDPPGEESSADFNVVEEVGEFQEGQEISGADRRPVTPSIDVCLPSDSQ